MSVGFPAIERPATGKPGWLHALDPRLKIIWLVWVSSLCVLVDGTAALLTVLILAVLPTTGLRVSRRGALAAAALILLTIWSTLLSQGMFYARQPRTPVLTLVPAFEWGTLKLPPLEIYREGLVYGLKQSLRLTAVMLAGLSVCLSTGPERLLAALTRLRVPVAVAYMTVAALRFLPTIMREVVQVRRARRLRTLTPQCRSTRRWWRRPVRALRDEFAIALPVLVLLLRRAETLATSVATRGFDPEAKRTFYPALRWRPLEWTLLMLLAVSWVWVAAAKLLYGLYVADIYYAPWARPLYDLVRRWL